MPRIHARRSSRRATNRLNQPYRILVGSTGEPSSLGAIRVALALARRKSASVHAIAVTTPFPHGAPSPFVIAPPPIIDADNRHTALEMLRHQLATVRGTGDWTIRATVGWAAESLIGAAERWPATVIIVGIGEHGVADRLIGSETAVKVARRSTIPLLAVPADALGLPTRAVAAIDFTPSSIAAATMAATLLGSNGTLTLLHASMLVQDEPEPGSLVDIYTAGAVEKLEEIRTRIHRSTRRPVASAVVRGEVVKELVGYAERAECDLIALGTHEQGVVDRLILGSVRTSVLRRVHSAVLVVPDAPSREV